MQAKTRLDAAKAVNAADLMVGVIVMQAVSKLTRTRRYSANRLGATPGPTHRASLDGSEKSLDHSQPSFGVRAEGLAPGPHLEHEFGSRGPRSVHQPIRIREELAMSQELVLVEDIDRAVVAQNNV